MESTRASAAFAVITRRGPHWLVRITACGLTRPLWRKYLLTDFPDPTQAALYAARHLPQVAQVTTWGWLFPAEGHSPGREPFLGRGSTV